EGGGVDHLVDIASGATDVVARETCEDLRDLRAAEGRVVVAGAEANSRRVPAASAGSVCLLDGGGGAGLVRGRVEPAHAGEVAAEDNVGLTVGDDEKELGTRRDAPRRVVRRSRRDTAGSWRCAIRYHAGDDACEACRIVEPGGTRRK